MRRRRPAAVTGLPLRRQLALAHDERRRVGLLLGLVLRGRPPCSEQPPKILRACHPLPSVLIALEARRGGDEDDSAGLRRSARAWTHGPGDRGSAPAMRACRAVRGRTSGRRLRAPRRPVRSTPRRRRRAGPLPRRRRPPRTGTIRRGGGATFEGGAHRRTLPPRRRPLRHERRERHAAASTSPRASRIRREARRVHQQRPRAGQRRVLPKIIAGAAVCERAFVPPGVMMYYGGDGP